MKASTPKSALLILSLLQRYANSEEYYLEPLAGLNPSCSLIFIIPSNKGYQYSFGDLLQNLHGTMGFTVVQDDLLTYEMGDELRKFCLCCDIVYFLSKNKEVSSVVQKVKMGSSRLVLVEPKDKAPVVEAPYKLQEVAMVLSGGQKLMLTCPPINRGDWPKKRILDVYSKLKRKWLGTFDKTSQLLHKYCNPGKGYYHGRKMRACGSFKGISLFMGAKKLATQVSQALGASSIKLVNTKNRGLVYDRKDIKNNTVLGEIYYGLSDFTTGVGGNPYVYGLIHNIRLAEGEFFFVGNRPAPMPKYQNIIFPFDTPIWIFLIISIPAMVSCMSLVYRWALHKSGEKFKKSYMLDVFFMTFGVALMENGMRLFQDSTLSKRGFSLRSLWLVCTFLLSMSYQGNLKASLTKKVFKEMPEDAYEMLERNLPVYVIDPGHDEKYYARHPNPWFNVMYKHVSQAKTLISRKKFSEILLKAFEGKQVFLQSSTGLDNIQRMTFTKKYGNSKEYPLIRIKKRYDTHSVNFVRQRYLQQTEDIEEKTHNFIENGIVQHDNAPAEIRDAENVSGGEKLELEHMLTPILILLGTLTMASISFLAEITCMRMKKSEKETKDKEYEFRA